jgi:hypothetical protein
MAQFKRGLSPECGDALRHLAEAKGGNWWKDVLASGKLLLAVRGGYLNAYVRGQSVFKIGSETGTGVDNKGPRVEVHYKYLIEPKLKAGTPYVQFDGKSFKIDPGTAVRTTYDSPETLNRMIQTALSYSGAEKDGVHQIAQREPKVVDLEIAFARSGNSSAKATALRMDLAVLIRWEREGARLVFCEAKCADNVELWMPAKDKTATGETPIAVVAQVRKYETFIRENADALVPAYRRVCRTLTDLHEQGWKRKLDDLVGKVANGVPLSIHPSVYLLVYGFDANQRNAVRRKLDALGKDGLLRNQIIAKGNPDQFRLEKDIGQRERSASK